MTRPAYTCPLCGQPLSLSEYQKILKVLKKKELASEKQIRLVHAIEERKFNIKLKRLEKSLRSDSKLQLQEDRERIVKQTEKKYLKANRSLRSILKSKELQLGDQQSRIQELERELKRQTTPQMEGLLYEGKLLAELRKRFPEDGFRHTGKGGDILQTVMRKDERAGLIVYECKRYRNYSKKFVKQAFDAMTKRKADFAIVVTNVMRKGTQGFFVEKGVMVVHATGVLSLAGVVRTHLMQISEMKLGRLQRDKAIRATLEYLEGPEFPNSLSRIIQESVSLAEDLMKEVNEHKSRWKKRYGSYKRVFEEAFAVKSTSKDLLSGEEPKKLLPKGLPELVSLPD